MLRQIVIIKKGNIIYHREYGETFSFEAIAPLFMSLTYFLEEAKENVACDILNTVFYKIAYSTKKETDMLFIFVTDISDPDEVIEEKIEEFNRDAVKIVEGA
jgi:hypothetical protein